MTKIKLILAKYSAFFLGLLVKLGIWGPLVISTVDAALIGVPLDPVVGGYTWKDPHLWWFWSLTAALGSAIGSLVPFAIGYAGGELFLLKRMDRKRLEAYRDKFERQEFFFLMVPAMLPPPTPMKLIVLCAGAFEMRPLLFVTAIFCGRLMRFFLLSLLVIKFGPEVVSLATGAAHEHLPVIFAVLAVSALGFWLWRRVRSRRKDVTVS